MARTFLAPPLSSAASEREFKVSKGIQGPKRTRLRPHNVEALLFLKHNLRAVGYRSDLPNAPAGFKCPNSSQYDLTLEPLDATENEKGEDEEEGNDLNISELDKSVGSESDSEESDGEGESDFDGF